MKNIKDINFNNIDLNQLLLNLNDANDVDKILSLASNNSISIKDFEVLPDIDISISKSGKFSSSDQDIQKMLQWIVIKSKIESLKSSKDN